MVQHPSLERWETSLKELLDALDDALEETFGSRFLLHPARRPRGATANKSHDGLFDIAAGFTLGLGSKHGRGYVIDIHISTLERVPPEVEKEVYTFALSFLRRGLKNHFPGRHLKVSQDGNVLKLSGDLSLGKV